MRHGDCRLRLFHGGAVAAPQRVSVWRAMSHVDRLANHRGLMWLIIAWLAVMLLWAVGLFVVENDVNEAMTSPLDALWWGLTTMTTVGYGDVFPTTGEGRGVAAVLMILGFGLYSIITATSTSSSSPTTGQGRSTRPGSSSGWPPCMPTAE
jgi:hypothetical protein